MDRAAAYDKLMLGVHNASVAAVEQALADGASVDGTGGTLLGVKVPPIWLASNCGHVDIIKLLIRRGADLDRATGGRWGSTGRVDYHFDDGSTEKIFNLSRPLHAAIYGGKVEALRVLLAAGANPNSTSGDGATPLMVACSANADGRPYYEAEQRIVVLLALLNAGADPTVKTPIGGHVIHFAATIGATQAVDLLLARVPSMLNDTDNVGATPLGCAVRKGQASTVSFLLSAGAREPAVWTPRIIRVGTLRSAAEQNFQEVVRILLNRGLETVGGVATVPEAMRSSIRLGFIGVLRLLLNVQGEERQEFWANRPVFSALDLISATFPAGTPIGTVHTLLAAKHGIPMLHVAAMYSSLRAAHVLLSAGADEQAVDSKGKRAADVVGDSQAADKKDLATESGLRRMLQRGPAFRARSWTCPAGTGPPVEIRPVSAREAASSSTRRASIVRIFRVEGRWAFVGRCARYAVKGHLPFLHRSLLGCP